MRRDHIVSLTPKSEKTKISSFVCAKATSAILPRLLAALSITACHVDSSVSYTRTASSSASNMRPGCSQCPFPSFFVAFLVRSLVLDHRRKRHLEMKSWGRGNCRMTWRLCDEDIIKRDCWSVAMRPPSGDTTEGWASERQQCGIYGYWVAKTYTRNNLYLPLLYYERWPCNERMSIGDVNIGIRRDLADAARLKFIFASVIRRFLHIRTIPLG